MSKCSLLDRNNSILVVIDLQEAFRSVIPRCELIAARIAELVRGCSLLKVPIIVTEQYPQGLGHTATEILNALGQDVAVVEKTSFSAWGSKEFRRKISEHGRGQVIVCGIETHICVGQTAQELVENEFEVHMVEDAVGSRFESDKLIALKRLYGLGVIPSSVETALFELTRDSKDPAFKDIQQISKHRADKALVDQAVGSR